MGVTLISLFYPLGLLRADMLADKEINMLALTSKPFRALVHKRSIRQLRICRKLKEPCDVFEVLEFLRKDPGERLGLCLLSLASQIMLIMAKPVCGRDTETESPENGGLLDQLMNLNMQPPLTVSEWTRLNEILLDTDDQKLLQAIFVRMKNFLFEDPNREHFRCQLVDREKDSPFRGPARKLSRLVLIVLAWFEVLKFVKDWPKHQLKEEHPRIRSFLEGFEYPRCPDWRHLPVDAVNEQRVPIQAVTQHLVYHSREGTQIFRKWHFLQGQPEFKEEVTRVARKVYLAQRSVHGFNEPGLQSAIRAFLRAYGIPDTPETTNPGVEEWETYGPLLLYGRFLLYIEQARSSRWWKLKDSECEEFDEHTRKLLRFLPKINKWRGWTIERDDFFENVKNGGPLDTDKLIEYMGEEAMLEVKSILQNRTGKRKMRKMRKRR